MGPRLANSTPQHSVSELDHGLLHELLGHLLRHAFNRGQSVFAHVFAEEHITPLQFMMAELIARNPGVTHSQISAAMGTSASVVTTALKPLIAAGHVAGAAGIDRRRMCYRLTPAGGQWFAALRPKIQQCEDLFARPLTTAQRTQLADMLRLLSGMNQSNDPD